MPKAILEALGNIGSFAEGLVAVVAAAVGFGALRDWERKRARDRRADVATRVIRIVAVTCEDMSAAVLAPALRAGYAEIAGRSARRGYVPVTRAVILGDFDRLMSRALDQVREVYKVNVEARVHLIERGEAEPIGQFLSACQRAEEAARSAALGTEETLSEEESKELQERLTTVSEWVIDAREHVVRILGPVARDGRPAMDGRRA